MSPPNLESNKISVGAFLHRHFKVCVKNSISANQEYDSIRDPWVLVIGHDVAGRLRMYIETLPCTRRLLSDRVRTLRGVRGLVARTLALLAEPKPKSADLRTYASLFKRSSGSFHAAKQKRTRELLICIWPNGVAASPRTDRRPCTLTPMFTVVHSLKVCTDI